MKKTLFLFAIAALVMCACSSNEPKEIYIPKNNVEFAGNAFSSFSLGADIKLYTVQNPEDKNLWTIQAVVPVRKEIATPINELSINVIMLDDNGVRVRDELVLSGEDIPNLLPVYNGGQNIERTIVFSIFDKEKKYLPANEAKELLEKTKGVRMDFNIIEAPVSVSPIESETAPAEAEKVVETKPSTPTEYPMTLDGLCRKYGVYGLLSRYDNALKNGDKSRAKRIEDQLWTIEKSVKANRSVPESLREKFVKYVEDREDAIEDRY